MADDYKTLVGQMDELLELTRKMVTVDMIDISWAELHSPMFLASGKSGVNLGVKLDPAAKQGMKLGYDRTHQELHVWYDGKHAFVPKSSVNSMNILGSGAPALSPAIPVTAPQQPVMPVRATAQVSTPQSHVFAGAGHGKTGK